MVTVDEIRIEDAVNPVTDKEDFTISFSMSCEESCCMLEAYQIRVLQGDKVYWDTGKVNSNQSLYLVYQGEKLLPMKQYFVLIRAFTTKGIAEGESLFMTGRMGRPWTGSFIGGEKKKFSKKQSPLPVTLRKKFATRKGLSKAYISVTAIGNYFLEINGKRVGKEYFAPGFTHYKKVLQYQVYDITEYLKDHNILYAVVSGGWAVGVYGMKKESKGTAKRQGLLGEIRLEYEDGTLELIATDDTWEEAVKGRYYEAGIYEGVSYDARINLEKGDYRKAVVLNYKSLFKKLLAGYGTLPYLQEELYPVSMHKAKQKEGYIYSFAQNFAGVVRLKIKNAEEGKRIIIHHGEILVEGELFTANLRSARAEVEYICRAGEQEFIPELTSMGFQHIRVEGCEPKDMEISGLVISSIKETGEGFVCSHELLNQLQKNIVWSGRGNFIDIPTDCPQRDERLGWTGDIAVFASTACFNFDMSRFFDKWLLDLIYEQGPGGSIPLVIPNSGKYLKGITAAGWCDSAILVPFAQYLAGGNRKLLERQYPSMKKMIQSEKFWASFLKFGRERYLFKGIFQFGDWLAPDSDFKEWFRKGKWIATAYFYQSCKIVSEVAKILDKPEDMQYYLALSEKIEDAFRKEFTNGSGKLLEEFQSAYVCPIYFGMLTEKERQEMGRRLSGLLEKKAFRLNTGFLGTPYLLFALMDTGHVETAYKVLLQEECPGWLYQVKSGATTIWERWDALKPDGTVNMAGSLKGKGKEMGKMDPEDRGIPAMNSFHHYANGAVGDFLYRRILGIEMIEGGYSRFRIRPIPGGPLTWAKGGTESRYGRIQVEWRIENQSFIIRVNVPVNTVCEVIMPRGEIYECGSGEYSFQGNI
ncbi:glycoside hydrolase family 78 protein [Lachnospiraceae bacterium OttesenSCG-928-D06]|nr:glycoside hydrolase family 78 protein [Lachnospiraceae bacterium OttesenSCG-928-D06]